MKKNDILDLKTKSTDELKRILLDLREEVIGNSSEKTLGKIKNTNFRKGKNKDIARVLTFLSLQKEAIK